MTPALKQDLIRVLADQLESTMFNDGQNRDYVLHGMQFIGLENMTDAELIDEFEMSVASVDVWTVSKDAFEFEFGDPPDEFGSLILRLRSEFPTDPRPKTQ